AGEAKAFRIEGLSKKSPLVQEENVTGGRSGSGRRIDRVGVDAKQSLAVPGVERADADFSPFGRAGPGGLSQVEEGPAVRREEGETVAEFALGEIDLGRRSRRASRGGDPHDGIAR